MSSEPLHTKSEIETDETQTEEVQTDRQFLTVEILKPRRSPRNSRRVQLGDSALLSRSVPGSNLNVERKFSSVHNVQLKDNDTKRYSFLSDQASSLGGFSDCNDDDDLCETGYPCLMQNRITRLPIKDFSSEVRASLDISKFLREAVLLLDMACDTLEEIVHKMLLKMLTTETQHDAEKIFVLVNAVHRALFTTVNFMDYSYNRLTSTLKGLSLDPMKGLTIDNSWLCGMCSTKILNRQYVGLARMSNPINLGGGNDGVNFVLLVIGPKKSKGTKSELELGRTLSTILAEETIRQKLLFTSNESEFMHILKTASTEIAQDQGILKQQRRDIMTNQHGDLNDTGIKYKIFTGMKNDIRRRIPKYASDYLCAFQSKHAMKKCASATLYLFFACLLPSIAFGVLNYNNTNGKMNVYRVIIAQTLGGCIFSVFGGQPLIIMLTTAPLVLYIKIIYEISDSYSIDFFAMYMAVGVFNSFFLIVYSCFNASRLMHWSTRSTEEVFALFVSIAFIVDAAQNVQKAFQKYYCKELLPKAFSKNIGAFEAFTNNQTSNSTFLRCSRDIPILYIFLLFGTLIVAIFLFSSTKTPFLNAAKRELMTDFAMPISVLFMSFIGTYVFQAVQLEQFQFSKSDFYVNVASIGLLSWKSALTAALFAFPLSLLFFMDQNIASAMVNSASHKLLKGSAYHWDLFVVGIVNAILSLCGLPWIHGALPHSTLHVKVLADIEESLDSSSNIKETIVQVQETRVTSLISHILIGLSLFMLPIPLVFIPVPVLDGLLVYMACTSLYGNQFFERILLLITEQTAYPPSHYIRKVPQRKLHTFTLLQILQLALLCALGFAPTPYAKMVFPVALIFQLFFRQKVIPRIINEKYLEALDRSI